MAAEVVLARVAVCGRNISNNSGFGSEVVAVVASVIAATSAAYEVSATIQQ